MCCVHVLSAEGVSVRRAATPRVPLVDPRTRAHGARSKQRKSRTCGDCRPNGGVHNGAWKGGRTTHRAGYVLLRSPGHPRATPDRPYAFEHILVMEQTLGRYLHRTETVHHRNGVKDDNRPGNLELWVRPQPTGIRASDAIEWAIELLERYGYSVERRRAR
jgi:hypothetical protein